MAEGKIDAEVLQKLEEEMRNKMATLGEYNKRFFGKG